MDDQELLALLRATSAKTPSTFFVKSAGANGVHVPFVPPQIDELMEVLWQYPAAKEFFFETAKTREFDMFKAMEMIMNLGRPAVNSIIALCTPLAGNPEGIKLIGKWGALDRLNFMKAVEKGSDWSDFFAALFKSTPADSPEKEVAPVAEGLTVEMLNEAVSQAQSPASMSAHSPLPSAVQTDAVARAEMPVHQPHHHAPVAKPPLNDANLAA